MMKKLVLAAMSALLLLCLNACEKDKIIDIPTQPAPINRIDYLLVDEIKNNLLIYGQFPDEKGTVTINGHALPIVSWSSALIVSDIPDTGDKTEGDVVIKSGESKSAPRRLYRWVIDLTSTRPHGGLSGDALEVAKANITIRGDIKPAPKHVITDGYSHLYRLSSMYYTAEGKANSQYDCGTVESEWQKTVKYIPLKRVVEDMSGKTHFQGQKEIRPDGFDVKLDFQAWEVIPMTHTVRPCTGQATVTQKMWSSQVMGFDGYTTIPLRFGEKNKIKSDTLEYKVYNSTQLIWNAEDGEKYARKATLSWECVRFPIED